jgi:hypothetical protein
MLIYYKNIVSKISDNGNIRCLCVSGKYDFEESKKDVIHTANYYIKECGYTCILEIEECCPECNNKGSLWKGHKNNKFRGKWIICPNCKGNQNWQKWIITI